MYIVFCIFVYLRLVPYLSVFMTRQLIHGIMYVCKYVFTYVCMYVRIMYVCTYVCIEEKLVKLTNAIKCYKFKSSSRSGFNPTTSFS